MFFLVSTYIIKKHDQMVQDRIILCIFFKFRRAASSLGLLRLLLWNNEHSGRGHTYIHKATFLMERQALPCFLYMLLLRYYAERTVAIWEYIKEWSWYVIRTRRYMALPIALPLGLPSDSANNLESIIIICNFHHWLYNWFQCNTYI